MDAGVSALEAVAISNPFFYRPGDSVRAVRRPVPSRRLCKVWDAVLPDCRSSYADRGDWTWNKRFCTDLPAAPRQLDTERAERCDARCSHIHSAWRTGYSLRLWRHADRDAIGARC